MYLYPCYPNNDAGRMNLFRLLGKSGSHLWLELSALSSKMNSEETDMAPTVAWIKIDISIDVNERTNALACYRWDEPEVECVAVINTVSKCDCLFCFRDRAVCFSI